MRRSLPNFLPTCTQVPSKHRNIFVPAYCCLRGWVDIDAHGKDPSTNQPLWVQALLPKVPLTWKPLWRASIWSVAVTGEVAKAGRGDWYGQGRYVAMRTRRATVGRYDESGLAGCARDQRWLVDTTKADMLGADRISNGW